MTNFDIKLNNIVSIEGQIELLSGLHIGAGDSGLHIGGTDSPVIKNPHTDQPYIPGSSLECKTGRFGSNQQKDADIIYKLDSLKNQVGGIFAQGLLISARELNHTTSKGDTVNTKERAQRHGLQTLEEKQIIKLPDLVRTWCEQGQLI